MTWKKLRMSAAIVLGMSQGLYAMQTQDSVVEVNDDTELEDIKRVRIQLPCGRELIPGEDNNDLDSLENINWALRYKKQADEYYDREDYKKAYNIYKKVLKILILKLGYEKCDDMVIEIMESLMDCCEMEGWYKKGMTCSQALLKAYKVRFGKKSSEFIYESKRLAKLRLSLSDQRER